jgi:hypothetical protein
LEFKTTISQSVDESWWDHQLQKYAYSTAYQTSFWAKLYEKTYDSKPYYIYITNSNDEIVGQLCILIHSKYLTEHTNYFKRFLISSLSNLKFIKWEYGPIIHDIENKNKIIEKFLSAIDQIAKQEHVTIIHGSSNPYELTNNDEFLQSGYSLQEWKTPIINLSDNLDSYFDNLDKNTRYDIRKSEKLNFKFETADKESQFFDFAKIGIVSREKQGESRILSNHRIKNDWEILYKKGYLKLFLVNQNKKTLSGIWCLIFNNILIQHGVVNSIDNSKESGTFLTWNSIKESIKLNYKFFDLGGANPNPSNKKEKNINFYKSKWATDSKPYYFYTKVIDKTKWNIFQFIKNPKKLGKFFK